VRFAEIDSTNEEARRRALAGQLEPCWLVAERQSSGRGRLGRQWESARGNLFATSLLAYPRSASEATLVSFAAAVAVLEAARMTGVDTSSLKLKWPNDVLDGKAKVAGILIETWPVGEQLSMAAGFGVNVTSTPTLPDRPAACLAGLPGGTGLTAEQVLTALDIAFRTQLVRLLSDGFGPVREDWLKKAAYLDQRVSIPHGATRIEGVMRGLADDGALIAEKDDGSLTHVRAGEISVLG
jgi:BirA family biotin operon repressor/biotin-[acetyl-CoA-carboxylase] ligase